MLILLRAFVHATGRTLSPTSSSKHTTLGIWIRQQSEEGHSLRRPAQGKSLLPYFDTMIWHTSSLSNPSFITSLQAWGWITLPFQKVQSSVMFSSLLDCKKASAPIVNFFAGIVCNLPSSKKTVLLLYTCRTGSLLRGYMEWDDEERSWRIFLVHKQPTPVLFLFLWWLGPRRPLIQDDV